MNHKSGIFKQVCFFIGWLFFLCAVFIAGNRAFADADVTLNWTAPTECTNGDAIGATELCGNLTRFILACSDVAGGPYVWKWATDAVNLADTRSYVDGDYYCVMRARNVAGISGDSNEIFFKVTTPAPTPSVPNPPASITIQVQASN